MSDDIPGELELTTTNLDSGIIAPHRAELDIRSLARILEDRLRKLVEIVEHRLDVFFVAICRAVETFWFKTMSYIA